MIIPILKCESLPTGHALKMQESEPHHFSLSWPGHSQPISVKDGAGFAVL